MTTSIRTSADGLSSIISINGVDKLTIDSNGKATATKFSGDGSELTGLIKSGTAINTTSGTAHDFTGIPAGVNRITVVLAGVSTGGTSPLILRGGAGVVSTTGYSSTVGWSTAATAATDGFILLSNFVAASTVAGVIQLVRVSGNTWVESGCCGPTSGGSSQSSSNGTVTLPGTLDRIRLTTANGTDTFDAGSVNTLYE